MEVIITMGGENSKVSINISTGDAVDAATTVSNLSTQLWTTRKPSIDGGPWRGISQADWIERIAGQFLPEGETLPWIKTLPSDDITSGSETPPSPD